MSILSVENRKLSLYVVISVMALLAIYFSDAPRLVTTMEPVPAELEIGVGSFYANTFRIHEVSPKLRVELDVVGEVTFKIGDVLESCQDGRCAHIVNLLGARETLPFEIYSERGAKVTHIAYDVVKHKSETTMSQVAAQSWLYVGVLFVVVLLVNYRFYSRQVLNQWLLIGLALGMLAINDWLFTLVLLAFLGIMYATRRWIAATRRSLRVWSMVLVAVAFLLLWKYGKDMVYAALDDVAGLSLFMPIGVSYFVIRLIDTLLRWFRKELTEISFREFLLFIIFPGTLLAGPIENIKDFYGNRRPQLDASDFGYGVSRVVIGLAKKFVLADAILYPMIHGAHGVGVGVDALILGADSARGLDVMAFAISGLLYAYIDFSAYSDIAIGLSRLFGYRICENFNYPMLASNIREYWKRWHMSLSNWAFRNVYFPVLLQTRNSYLPLYMTMLLIGLWHAFSFSWFSWAVHHATGMSVVALFQQRFPKISKSKNRVLHVVSVLATVIYASMGFVFVYLDDYQTALSLYLAYWKLIIPFWS